MLLYPTETEIESTERDEILHFVADAGWSFYDDLHEEIRSQCSEYPADVVWQGVTLAMIKLLGFHLSGWAKDNGGAQVAVSQATKLLKAFVEDYMAGLPTEDALAPPEASETETTEMRRTVSSPRLEVVLVPEPAGQLETFETWMVLHIPDGKQPETHRLYDAADRTQSLRNLDSVYTTIGEHHRFHSDFEAGNA